MKLQKIAIGLLVLAATLTGVSTSTLANSTAPVASNKIEQTQQQLANRRAKSNQATRFKVRIENISAWDGQTASNGTKWTQDFSPGVWLVHGSKAPVYSLGRNDRGQGVEAIAEDGDPANLAKVLKTQSGIESSGIFNTAVGAIKVGGIRPGQAFEFTISAQPGEKLSFVTMFGQSNDWFYAPSEAGIALFNAAGQPISGDVTSQVLLLDSGTEVDQEPGIGSEQGPRQKAPNTGTEENGVVRLVGNQFSFPATGKLMRVTIMPIR